MELSVEDIKLVIAKMLRDRRIAMGMTQFDLANRMGVLQPHVARMEVIGPGTVELLMKAVTSLDMRLILEPSPTAKAVKDVLEAPTPKAADKALDKLFDAEPDTPFEVKPGNIRVKSTCPNGHLLQNGRDKCSFKGCKYA